MKITAPIVFVFLLFSAIPSFASQFQPIMEITEFEKEIISNAAKKPAEGILKDAIGFRINFNLVILKFKNGNEGYYGFGEKPPKTSAESRAYSDDYEQENSGWEKTSDADDYAKRLWNNFYNTSLEARYGITANEEKMIEADNFMREFHNLLLSDMSIIKERINNTSPPINIVLGNRGNRYYYVFEAIQNYLTASKQLEFYNYYVDPVHVLEQDQPTYSDIYLAIQNVKLIILNNPKPDLSVLYSIIAQIEKIDPQILEELKQAGKI